VIVCIDGLDASGKATQSKILAERLNAKLFSFPDYSTPAGKAILAHLKGEWIAADLRRVTHTNGLGEVCEAHWPCAHDPLVLQSLMLANRLELGAELRAAADSGHVICDRYDAAAMVYGTLDGLDPTWLESTNAQLPVRPDLYILIDISVEESFKRRPERRDRYEKDVGFLEKVREGYLRLFAEKHKERATHRTGAIYRIVHGLGTVVEVSAAIAAIVAEAVHIFEPERLKLHEATACARNAREVLCALEKEFGMLRQRGLVPQELDLWTTRLGNARHDARVADRELVVAQREHDERARSAQ
jgi:dTMP kinase